MLQAQTATPQSRSNPEYEALDQVPGLSVAQLPVPEGHHSDSSSVAGRNKGLLLILFGLVFQRRTVSGIGAARLGHGRVFEVQA